MNGESDLGRALDPCRSVVVEACAGSGKTWLLVSRMLRLLLAGVAPGEILAITFTRKAAREIETRLFHWLELLATGSEAEVGAFLEERCVAMEARAAAVRRARGLFEQVQTAAPGLTVSTFHGWFARLVQGAPLSSGLAGFTLHDSGRQLKEEAWQLFADEMASVPSAPAQSLLWLLENVGLDGARELLFGFVDRRSEWHASATVAAGPLEAVLAQLRRELDIGPGDSPADPSADPSVAAALREYVALLRCSDLKTDIGHAAQLETALQAVDAAARFENLRAVFLTAEGALRQKDATPALMRRFGTAAPRLLELHAHLGAVMLATEAGRAEWRAWEFNRHALTAGAAFLDAIDRYKHDRRLMDFADLEWHVSRMTADDGQAGFLQARLDARYRHILLDEFQDTNPLQWQILLGWLGAYGAEANRPCLFVVGDPKQSIYRFRRADPRVFAGAAEFLVRRFDALHIETDATRRNATAIVEVINRLFSAEAGFRPFRAHRALRADLPGRVEVLPLCGGVRDPAVPSGRLRDPLREPEAAADDPRRRMEALQLATRLSEMVGRWTVRDAHDGHERSLRYGDVMILTRRRSALPEFERALRAARIPYLSLGMGGLLRTLEAADITALLRCLVTPADSLSLAHSLRSPLLAIDDADLLALAARPEPDWWRRLRGLAVAETGSATVRRAAGLLEAWQAAAARLPVHDLLDRIYHEGDVVARYRTAVPAAMWPGVAANLEAFIALALDVDAGRYPSLPRFLDALARMRREGDEAAPDEGMPHGESAEDSVRIHTIHGAKGLEAPVVWLVDAHNSATRTDTYGVLLDWPPGMDRPQHFSLTGRKGERGARRDGLFAAEAVCAERESLNLLYVALTRARQYFFVSGIEPTRTQSRRSAWDRIADAVIAAGGVGGIHGECPRMAGWAQSSGPIPMASLPALRQPPPVGVRRAPPTPGMLYGERLHATLECLSAGRDRAIRPACVPAAEWPEFRRVALTILDQPALARFFDPAQYRRAWNEIEFSLADGRVGRIDRLVEFADGFWVLDFKSGSDDASHAHQLAGYCTAVAAVFPNRPIRSAIVRADGTLREF